MSAATSAPAELDRRLDELDRRGVDVIAVSGENRERTATLANEWELERLSLAYGLTEDQMRNWGLFISDGIKAEEPALFNESGLFLISPDHTVYYESVLSMPVGRDLTTSWAASTIGPPPITLHEAKRRWLTSLTSRE